jgi:hypothetical protein
MKTLDTSQSTCSKKNTLVGASDLLNSFLVPNLRGKNKIAAKNKQKTGDNYRGERSQDHHPG